MEKVSNIPTPHQVIRVEALRLSHVSAGHSRLPGWLAARSAGRLRLLLLDWVVLAAFTCLTIFGALRHEPWFDEAQAWLLARDAPFLDLLTYYLRPEGSPALWHAILAGVQRLGMPYAAYSVFSSLFAIAAVFVILRWSPFPAPIRLLLPFTYFLAYQYAVIARSYVLLAPLIFAAAAIYGNARKRFFLFLAILALLANVSVHGTLIAIGLLAAYLLQTFQQRRTLTPGDLRKHLLGSSIFILMLGALALQLYPIPGQNTVNTNFSQATSFYAMPLHRFQGSMSGMLPLSAFVLAASAVWLSWRKSLLPLLIPYTLLLVLFTFKVAAHWHDGALYLVWIAALWIAWPTSKDNQDWTLNRRILQWGTPSILLLLTIAPQIWWTFASYRCDLSMPYSGAKAAGDYLKSHGWERRRLSGYRFSSNAILPYLSTSGFYNHAKRGQKGFWSWLPGNPMAQRNIVSSQIVEDHPDGIVFGTKIRPSPRKTQELRDELWPLGYCEARRFPGAHCWKTRIYEDESFVLFVRCGELPVASARVEPAREASCPHCP